MDRQENPFCIAVFSDPLGEAINFLLGYGRGQDAGAEASRTPERKDLKDKFVVTGRVVVVDDSCSSLSEDDLGEFASLGTGEFAQSLRGELPPRTGYWSLDLGTIRHLLPLRSSRRVPGLRPCRWVAYRNEAIHDIAILAFRRS